MATGVDLPSGSEIAGHRIEQVIGEGGMGVVYRARQLRLDRIVALEGALAVRRGRPHLQEAL